MVFTFTANVQLTVFFAAHDQKPKLGFRLEFSNFALAGTCCCYLLLLLRLNTSIVAQSLPKIMQIWLVQKNLYSVVA